MRTVKIINTYRDLKEGLLASNQADGLEYYAPEVFRSRNKLLEKVHNFHLLETGELAYVTWLKCKHNDSKYGILHLFSWASCLDNSPAAIVTFDHEPNGDRFIQIGNYEFNRDDLRGDGYIWTTDSF